MEAQLQSLVRLLCPILRLLLYLVFGVGGVLLLLHFANATVPRRLTCAGVVLLILLNPLLGALLARLLICLLIASIVLPIFLLGFGLLYYLIRRLWGG